MQLTSGTLLHGGAYIIEKTLGQGSFGITYLAEHTSLGRKVAIKEFFMKELNSRGEDGSITGLTDGSLSYNYALKFRKEAQNLARMDNPNIVRVTDCFDENGTFYYVMDYIEGQDLNSYVKQQAISETEAVSIITDVANALIYMHEEKHMLHLDLKPGNVMRRNSDGHIFLIDFGLSKHFSTDGQPETSTTIGLGTPGYAPIEQSNRAANGEFRPTIDVYALGATLYKLLTRETPPPASDLVSDDELLLVSMKEKNISESLINVVVKAMLPNVKKRTQSIGEFSKMLVSSMSSSCTSTPTISDSKEETLFIHDESHANKQQESASIANPTNSNPKEVSPINTQEKGNRTLKYVISAVVLCILGIGGYYMVTPSNKDKFLEAYNLYWGIGTEQDQGKAMQAINELAQKDYGPAVFMQGWDMSKDDVYPDDSTYVEPSGIEYYKKAFELLPKEADKGDYFAQYYLAECYSSGLGTDVDEKKAFTWYLKASENGLSRAMSSLAFCYLAGKGTNENKSKALEWQTKSAETGDATEQYNLGFFYLNGFCADSDTAKAIPWFEKAADQGSEEAMVYLGTFYKDGSYVKKDIKKAIEYYQAAADKNHTGGLFQLGLLYFFGNDVTADKGKAIKYMTRVLDNEENSDAHLVLGYCYMEDNPKESFTHMKIAAEAGDPTAQYQLACMYQQGSGVKADQRVAEQWYRKAIANGYQE